MSDFRALAGEDPFCFACTQCGECCFDQLVLLEPLDLFWLSRLGGQPNLQSSVDLFSAGLVSLQEQDREWRCVLVMPSFQRGTKCRFLTPHLTDEGRLLRWSCALHPKKAKPFVCSLSPVARTLEDQFYLVPPVEDCPGMNRGKETTLQGYLEAAQLTERLSFSIWFHRVVRSFSSQSKERAEAVYNFDQEKKLESPEELRSYLCSLVEGYAS